MLDIVSSMLDRAILGGVIYPTSTRQTPREYRMATVFRLREAMESKDPPPSLRQIAKASGVSYTTVHAIYHNSTTRVDLATLGSLAQVLQVNAGDLVGESRTSTSRRRFTRET
jgi:transcriptional regulator with XRE-family HTH domain